MIELGVNDLKKCTGSPDSYRRVVNMAKESILKLLASSSKSKICVSLPTPTPSNIQLNKYIEQFNQDMNDWICGNRDSNLQNSRRRLYTINNRNFSDNSPGKMCPFSTDMLHVNSYGLKKLIINMKFGVYRAFGWKYTYTSRPHASNSS